MSQSLDELKSAKFHGGARGGGFRGGGARAFAAGDVVLARATLVHAFQVLPRCFRGLVAFVKVPLHGGVPQRSGLGARPATATAAPSPTEIATATASGEAPPAAPAAPPFVPSASVVAFVRRHRA